MDADQPQPARPVRTEDGVEDQRQSIPAESDSRSDPISLESLTSAFAEMMRPPGPPGDSDTDAPAGVEIARDEDSASSDAVDAPRDESSPQDAGEISPKTLLEAMLFVGHPDRSPVTSNEMAALMRGVDPEELDALVRHLNQQYDENGCPYRIISQGAGYRLTLREEYARVRERFYGRVREARLSQAAVEVLSIVAYKGPLTADDVNRVRGKPSGPILAQLVRRQLLEYHRNQQRRSATYTTTPRFLDVFGLESLDDLPRSEDLDKN